MEKKTGEAKASKAKKAKVLLTDPAWCKGCGICVAFCPKNVLELVGEKVHVRSIEDCIKCSQCELRCPDYAIWLEEVE